MTRSPTSTERQWNRRPGDRGRHPRALPVHVRRPASDDSTRAAQRRRLRTHADGLLQASVERQSLADLVAPLTTDKLKFQLAELAAIPRAPAVVEERYSQVFKRDRVRPSVVADGIAECQIRFPTVPIVFCETRKLTQEWTYRFLAAARVGLSEEMVGDLAVRGLESAPALAPAPPAPSDVRRWASAHDIVVPDRGRIPAAVRDRYLEARTRGEI